VTIPRSATAALVLLSLGAGVSSASAKTGAQAAREAALARLGPALGRSHDGVVFGLGRALPRGTVVGDAAPARTHGAEAFAAPGLRLARAAYLFWLDTRYPQRFDHGGRLVLVDARSARVMADRATERWPAIDGRAPAFIAHRGPGDRPYRVATRFAAAHRVVLASRPVVPAPSAAGAQAAAPFADDCLISLSDARGKADQKTFNAFWSAHGALVFDEATIPVNDPGRAKDHPGTPNGDDVETLVQRLPARCRDVIIYVNGEGSESASGQGISVSDFPGEEGPVEQTFTPTNWSQILKANPGRQFKLVVDGCHSGVFLPVSEKFPNAVVTLTATGTGFLALTPAYGPFTFTLGVVGALERQLTGAQAEDPADGVSLGARVLGVASDLSVLRNVRRALGVPGFLFLSGAGKRRVNLPPFRPAPPPSAPAGPEPAPGPTPQPDGEAAPDITQIQAQFPEGATATQYSVTVHALPGRGIDYAWSLTPPADDPTCNHLEQLAAPRYALWHHSTDDGCHHFGTQHNGVVKVVATVHWPEKHTDWTCTATYDGTLSGLGPTPGPCTASST
jgi:hypothetical protein